MAQTYSKKFRHPRVHVSSFLVNHIHVRNPWVAVWWSAAFPGFGHAMLSKYFTGSMLMLWEFFINLKAHINLAIFYSMTGQFEVAKSTIDIRWFFLYIGVYIFAIWDSYKKTEKLNSYALLADREDSSIQPVNISALELNFVHVRNPWYAVFWSFVTPGLGHVFINRLPTGFFMLICFMTTIFAGGVLPAFFATMTGNFAEARSLINPEWLLFLPSLYGFASYDSFLNCNELNKLYKIEQSRFLSDNYQAEGFHFIRQGGNAVRFVSAFQHSESLELAIIELEQMGIPKDRIFTAPLDKNNENLSLLKTTHDGADSMVDLIFILASIGMLLGSIYGFVLRLGPILWGLFGIIIGGVIGLLTEYIVHRSIRFKRKKTRMEVVLLVDCERTQTEEVEHILWSHSAIGVAKA